MLGHSLGRWHVHCTGTENYIDTAYPNYPQGWISQAQSPSDPATWYGLDSEGLRLWGQT